MASTATQFTTIRSEGGLLPASLLERVARPDPSLPGMTTDAYHLAKSERFGEVINRSWLRLLGAWAGLREALAQVHEGAATTGLTRDRWLTILFQELGYGRLQPAKAIIIDGTRHPVSHEWGPVPIHLVGAGVRLDTRTAGVVGAARSSPHSLVQDLLNRSDDRLWGIVSNGLQLRMLRDNLSLTRQAFVEFDLEAMMDGEVYADFTVLWLLAHQSRVEGDHPESCWLERWSIEARTQGSRALEHLADGVEAAIEALGQGFLSHADNRQLRADLDDGTLRREDLYRQLLRVVYRILFILVAEERDRLLDPTASEEARDTYVRFYSLGRIRELAEKRRGTRHTDLWHQIRIVVDRLASLDGCPELGLPALGSDLFAADATPALNDCSLANVDLLTAMRDLSGRNDERAGYRWRFDYRNLGAEELGSVYETLLDLEPEVNVPAGSFVLNAGGAERRSTGSHYTPTPILKKVLDFALEPAVARALAAENPEAALLALRILDPACGSGHFLIAAGHRIAQALAQVRTGETAPAPEAVGEALRDVVAGCLYGVDLNPMAVELCRVALWLDALEPGKPLSFLGHHIRVGNSLLGVPLGATVARNRAAVDQRRKELEACIDQLAVATRGISPRDPEMSESHKKLKRLRKDLDETVYDSWPEAIPDLAFKPSDDDDDRAIARKTVTRNAKERRSNQLTLSNVLVELPDDVVDAYRHLGAGAEATVAESTRRAKTFDGLQGRPELRHRRLLADTWSAAWFWPLADEERPPTQAVFASLQTNARALPTDAEARVLGESARHRLFHFELEFPDVFDSIHGGFDIVLGNPPYLGGMRISTVYGAQVHAFLKGTTTDVRTGGRVDLAAYFLRRGYDLVRDGGELCFITTNTVGETGTRAASLVPIMASWGGELVNVVRSEPWEGEATVSVAIIHIHRGPADTARTLDGVTVDHISSDLTSIETADPIELTENTGVAFAGTNILGTGFTLTRDDMRRLLDDEPAASVLVKPFYGGRDLMGTPDPGSPRRWVIDFGQRTEDEASAFRESFRIVRERVKPQRDEAREARVRDRWWIFGRPAAALQAAIRARQLERVIAIPEVSKHMRPVWLPADGVYQHTLVVFAKDDYTTFGLLASSVHWLWVTKRCRSMRTDPTYNPARGYGTFPRPSVDDGIEVAAKDLDMLRARVSGVRDIGLTAVYNLVDDPLCSDLDVLDLRQAQVDLDRTVLRAYGWDIDLQFGHHETERFGQRWMPAPGAQRDIEAGLLHLNHSKAAVAR